MPSGFNKQPWRFILVKEPNLRARMVEEVRRKLDEIIAWPGAKGKEKILKARSRDEVMLPSRSL